MAIKLKLQETQSAKFNVSSTDALKFKVEFGGGGGVLPPAYTGEYEVTPTEETQVLATQGKIMTDNVTVNPIPNNYGLITWNGSVLTVS